jgi:hypothetical protein
MSVHTKVPKALLIMTKLQSPLDVAMEMLRDLEEFERSGSKEAFRKQLREEFVRRSGAASLDEALVTAMTSLVPLLRQTSGPSRKRAARSPKPRKPVGSNPR